MRRTLVHVGLSLIVVLTAWNPLPAKEPPVLNPNAPPAATCAANPPAPTNSRWNPLRRLLNGHGYVCQADPDLLCSSPHQDLRFIFGSCRSFFGEACAPTPPHGR